MKWTGVILFLIFFIPFSFLCEGCCSKRKADGNKVTVRMEEAVKHSGSSLVQHDGEKLNEGVVHSEVLPDGTDVNQGYPAEENTATGSEERTFSEKDENVKMESSATGPPDLSAIVSEIKLFDREEPPADSSYRTRRDMFIRNLKTMKMERNCIGETARSVAEDIFRRAGWTNYEIVCDMSEPVEIMSQGRYLFFVLRKLSNLGYCISIDSMNNVRITRKAKQEEE